LNDERGKAERGVSRPTEVPGDGRGSHGGHGRKEFASAFEALNKARDAGLPGLKEYINELGKIGTARPDLAGIVEK
jgi:hypothetical protein